MRRLGTRLIWNYSLASHTYFSVCAIPRARKRGEGKEKYDTTLALGMLIAASGSRDHSCDSTQLTCNHVSAVMLNITLCSICGVVNRSRVLGRKGAGVGVLSLYHCSGEN